MLKSFQCAANKRIRMTCMVKRCSSVRICVNAGEGAASRHQSSSGYDKMMTELERSMRGSALRCRSGPGKCENFGNSRCDGYCHECYQLQQFTSTAYWLTLCTGAWDASGFHWARQTIDWLIERQNRGPPKRGPHRPEDVTQQHIFWPLWGSSLWRFATFESSLGAAWHSVVSVGLRLPSSESHTQLCTLLTLTIYGKLLCINVRKFMCSSTFLPNRPQLFLIQPRGKSTWKPRKSIRNRAVEAFFNALRNFF